METNVFVDKFSYITDGGVKHTQTTKVEIPEWIFHIIDIGKWYFGSYEKFMRWHYKNNNLNTWKDIGNALEVLRKARIDKMLEKMNMKGRYVVRKY
jgi:hypothetical protein